MIRSNRNRNIKEKRQTRRVNSGKLKSPWWNFWPRLLIAIISVVIGSITAGIITYVTTEKANVRSKDVEIAKQVFDILDKKNPSLYPSLDTLVESISDTSLKKAMGNAINANPEVPRKIKQGVDTIAQKNITCAIYYLKGDSIAKEDAEAIKEFLSNERKSLFQYYPFKEYYVDSMDTNWFITHFPYSKEKGVIYKDILIYYNNQIDAELAARLYFAMKEGIFGIIYIESFGGTWERNLANEGNGFLKGRSFEDVNSILLEDPNNKLSDYDFAIVIPPQFNAAILDSVYLPHR